MASSAPSALPGTVGDVKLDAEQQACVDLPVGPLAIVAGPGAGKTRTVVARISALGIRGEVDPTKILAVTHTTKAAGELKDRLARAGAGQTHVSTIHAMAWRQLRRFAPLLGEPEPKLQAATFGFVKDAASAVVDNPDTAVVMELISEIDWAAASLLNPDTYALAADRAGREISINGDKVAEVWTRYIARKQRAGVIDFADVLRLATEQLSKPFARGAIDNAFHAVFVDEFQDVDALGYGLIQAWLGDRDSLCVVGDPDQAIFSFKGGDPALLLGFKDEFPNATSVTLRRNYRSTTDIVGWVNATALHKKIPLTSERGFIEGPGPRCELVDTEEREEAMLVEQLRRWHTKGRPWRDMAVLYRYNAISARLEAALTSAGIPYAVAGGANFFERREVKNVLVAFGKQARITPDEDGMLLLVDAAAENGWDRDTVPDGMGAARQRYDAVLALCDLVDDRYPNFSAHALLAALQERAKDAHDAPVDAVSLATIHASKGLEWPCVWLVSCTDGVMPSSFAKTRTQLDEERHLFYVAISRAETELVVSAARKRRNNFTSRPSPFLDLVGVATKATAKRRGSSGSYNQRPTPERVIAACPCGGRLIGAPARTTGACSGPCLSGKMAESYTKLVTWRDDLAVERNVPHPKIASNKALFSVAVRADANGVSGLGVAPEDIPVELYQPA